MCNERSSDESRIRLEMLQIDMPAAKFAQFLEWFTSSRSAGKRPVYIFGNVTSSVDKSTGATGAKVIASGERVDGRASAAQTVTPTVAAELLQAFRGLIEQMTALRLADSCSLHAVIEALEKASNRAALPEPPKEEITSAWEKAKSWLEKVLAVGVFAADKAEVVRQLIEKTTKLLR